MTKLEIINEIAAKTGFEKNEVSQIIEALMKTIKDNMCAGHEIFLRGFRTFQIKKRAEKIGRNISTKTPVVIPAHYVPAFKPVKEFKDAVSRKVN